MYSIYWTPATIGEEDLCVRVMGETLLIKRRRLLESVLLERGRPVVVVVVVELTVVELS